MNSLYIGLILFSIGLIGLISCAFSMTDERKLRTEQLKYSRGEKNELEQIEGKKSSITFLAGFFTSYFIIGIFFMMV